MSSDQRLECLKIAAARSPCLPADELIKEADKLYVFVYWRHRPTKSIAEQLADAGSRDSITDGQVKS